MYVCMHEYMYTHMSSGAQEAVPRMAAHAFDVTSTGTASSPREACGPLVLLDARTLIGGGCAGPGATRNLCRLLHNAHTKLAAK